MPKLIDADKLIEWLEKSEAADKFWTTTVEPIIKFDLITDAINSGTFDPTPVQPDIKPGDRVLHGIHGIGTVESEVYIPTPTVTVDFDKYVLLHSSPITEL